MLMTMIILLQLLTLFSIEKTLRRQRKIIRLLKEIKATITPGVVVSGGIFTIIDGQKQEINGMNLKKGQKIPLILDLKDKDGAPAAFDGEPVWAIDNEALASFELVDGVRYVKHGGSPGAVIVSVEGDADQGDGVKTLRFEGALNLLSGDVETGELKFGEAVDI